MVLSLPPQDNIVKLYGVEEEVRHYFYMFLVHGCCLWVSGGGGRLVRSM